MNFDVDRLAQSITLTEFKQFLNEEIALFGENPEMCNSFCEFCDWLLHCPGILSIIRDSYNQSGLFKNIYHEDFENILGQYLYFLFLEDPGQINLLEFNVFETPQFLKRFFKNYALTDRRLFLSSLKFEIQYDCAVLECFFACFKDELTQEELNAFWDQVTLTQKLTDSFINKYFPFLLTPKRATAVLTNNYVKNQTTFTQLKKHATKFDFS